MSDELTALEESITEVLLDLMTERVMSKEECPPESKHHRREECKPPHRLLEQEHLEPTQREELSIRTT
jgi:hypothetical protein